jgi:hypothetical protein
MVSRAVYPQYRRDGRFFGRRVNCEYVPALPAWAVRRVLDDPRRIPYLLLWKSPSDGEIKEAVRVVCLGPTPYLPEADSIEVKRTDGSLVHLRVLKRPRARDAGRDTLLACPNCCALRRALYAWEPGGRYTSSVQTCGWLCRRCAGLRYSSEGGALVLRGRGRWFRALEMEYGTTRSDRPDPWYPYIFTSPADAMAAGLAR